MSNGPPKELVDPLVLSRELWSFFISVLKSDHVLHKNATDLIMPASFDDMDLEQGTHFVEAMKTMVIDPWMMAYHNSSPPVFDALTDNFMPDFQLKSHVLKSDKTYPCYGCGSIVYSNLGSLCFKCGGFDPHD